MCIYRIPESKSIVSPGSACPRCDSPIRFYDNIPILSYFFLRGRCRQCFAVISIRYPAIEILTGLLAVFAFYKFGLTFSALLIFAFSATLTTASMIDLDHFIIPDVITLPGIPLCFAASFGLPEMTPVKSLIGILVGGGCLYTVAWLYRILRKGEGMGMGDVKLLAMIGAFIGPVGVVITIFTGSAIGTIIGLATSRQSSKGMQTKIPFGPFLSIGALVYLFFGPQLIDLYLNLI